MAAEEDNFDIDIYGDGEGELGTEEYKQEEDHNLATDTPAEELRNGHDESTVEPEEVPGPESSTNGESKIPNTEGVTNSQIDYPKQAPQQQGVKRKETSDERPIDPGATNALLISDLHWWITEDDIRGWANQAGCEDELKDVTFSEHKVNGKSKGYIHPFHNTATSTDIDCFHSQVFVEFSSPQASTAMKHQIESLASSQPNARKHTIVYTNPSQNPFKTLPKDAPMRGNKDDRPQRSGSQGSYNSPGGVQQNNYGMNNSGGYRGGRGGGYGNRAGGFNNAGYNNNRNFSGQMGGYNNSVGRGGGYQNTNMGMNNFGGGYNQGAVMMGNNMRGGMGGMRGGRGGMGGGMMPMGGMGMGMAGMGMNPMMAGMGMQGMFYESWMLLTVLLMIIHRGGRLSGQ
jgi:hypothetical protein